MRRVLRFIVLPPAISEFERAYLARVNRVALVFFALHVPAFALLAYVNATGPLAAVVLTAGVLVGPLVASLALRSPRVISVVHGVTAMFMGGLLVHFGQGPVQIEMHFYFFALLAMLAIFANPVVIVAATVTVALHHLVLWFVLPSSVFNYAAPLWVVVVHAVFVILEATATCFIARSFFDNVIGLEKIVRARTAELDARTAEMRLVLDNVEQGFVTIDRAGTMSPERSATFDRWFAGAPAGTSLFLHLGERFPQFAQQSALAFDQVVEGLLPLEVSLAQMPTDLSDGKITWRFEYRGVGDVEAPERFLAVVTDVTAERARVSAEQERRETLQILERMLTDRAAFKGFVEEGKEIVETVCRSPETDLPAVKRGLHTLKGNAGIFGLESVAELCHEMESHIVEEGCRPRADALARLEDKLRRLADDVEMMSGGRSAIEIDEAQHRGLLEAIRDGQSRLRLLRRVLELKLEPVRLRAEHAAEQARRIAARLGKPSPEVEIEDQGDRLDPKPWGRFWSAFVHVIRNAVDHGLEGPEERRASGKPEVGLIRMRAAVDAGRFVVELSDDGRGIDWGHIKELAGRRGLAAETEEDLVAALLADGVSTAAQVTDVSGRGVGMGAVLAATSELGGSLSIESEIGRGTTVRFSFPIERMAPDLEHLVRDAA